MTLSADTRRPSFLFSRLRCRGPSPGREVRRAGRRHGDGHTHSQQRGRCSEVWVWVKNQPPTAWFSHGVHLPGFRLKICTRNGILVNGNMDQNLRFSGGLILTHTHVLFSPSEATASGIPPALNTLSAKCLTIRGSQPSRFSGNPMGGRYHVKPGLVLKRTQRTERKDGTQT